MLALVVKRLFQSIFVMLAMTGWLIVVTLPTLIVGIGLVYIVEVNRQWLPPPQRPL